MQKFLFLVVASGSSDPTPMLMTMQRPGRWNGQPGHIFYLWYLNGLSIEPPSFFFFIHIEKNFKALQIKSGNMRAFKKNVAQIQFQGKRSEITLLQYFGKW